MTKVITQIEKPNSDESLHQKTYDFGVFAENVFFVEKDGDAIVTQATLKDFYDYVLNTFNNGFFTFWGKEEPTAMAVRDWYYIEPYEL